MALRGQMVDFVWPHLAYDVRKIARTADVAVVQMQLHRVAVVGVPVGVVQPVGVEAAGPTQDAVYLVAFGQENFGQIGTVLAGDAGNQCSSPVIRCLGGVSCLGDFRGERFLAAFHLGQDGTSGLLVIG